MRPRDGVPGVHVPAPRGRVISFTTAHSSARSGPPAAACRQAGRVDDYGTDESERNLLLWDIRLLLIVLIAVIMLVTLFG